MSENRGEIRFGQDQPGARQGYVSGSWTRYPRANEIKGLCLYTWPADHKGAASWGVHFAENDDELLVWYARLAAGLSPPGVFADWLEDNAERLYPLLYDWAPSNPGYDLRANWNGVLAELRRLDAPPPDPKSVIELRRADE